MLNFLLKYKLNSFFPDKDLDLIDKISSIHKKEIDSMKIEIDQLKKREEQIEI